MNKIISGAALAVGALALGVAGVNATTFDTKQMTVQVNVLGACAITTYPPIQFQPLIANQPTTQDQLMYTALLVTCSGSYNVQADAGQNAGGDITKRAMKSSASSDLISYNLYTGNTNLTTVWGSTAGTNTLSGTGSGYANFTARLPTGTTPKDTATYTDVVTVTLTN